MTEDVETTRALEQALLRRVETYAQILDALPDMILVKGAHSRILWANKAFRDYYGMTNEQLRELVDAPFNAPDHTQQYVADDLLVYTTGRDLEIPLEPVTRHDGVVAHFHTKKWALRDEVGAIRATVGVSRNVGETLELRGELLRYREQLERDRFSTFASQLPGFFFQSRRTGTESRFTFASARVHEYYGVTPAELLADPVQFYRHVPDRERVREELREAFRVASESGGTITHVHRARGPDGVERWMELRAAASREADESVTYHGYVHDISERHRSEELREELVEKLRARNREMEQFTYTISHDLKSPLVTIRGFVGGIEEDVRAGNAQRALTDLARVRAAAEKMARMLSELLELSRVGRVGHHPVEVRVGDVIAETRELLAAQLANVELVVEGDDVRVMADRTRLTQVCQNLLENAVKYMGPQPSPRIVVRCREDAGQLWASVSDNGIGIAPAHQERIFGLFEKLDGRSEGTGIGLALVKTIVELHRGKVWVESEGPGKGSTFHVRMPLR
ncbi:MAG: ATP-binding protein [Sandaracinus sp.]